MCCRDVECQRLEHELFALRVEGRPAARHNGSATAPRGRGACPAPRSPAAGCRPRSGRKPSPTASAKRRRTGPSFLAWLGGCSERWPRSRSRSHVRFRVRLRLRRRRCSYRRSGGRREWPKDRRANPARIVSHSRGGVAGRPMTAEPYSRRVPIGSPEDSRTTKTQ